MVLLMASAKALASEPASPPPAGWHLVVVTPKDERCPSTARLAQVVAARLKEDPWHAPATGQVKVHINRSGKDLVANIAMVHPDGRPLGTRTLRHRAGHCPLLMDAVALTISIAMDPLAAFRPAPPALAAAEPPPETPPPAPPTPLAAPPAPAPAPALPAPLQSASAVPAPMPTAAPPQSAPKPPPTVWRPPRRNPWLPPRLQLGLHSGMLVDVAVAPHAVPGGVVGTTLRWGPGAWLLEVQVEMPGRRTVDGATVVTRLTLGTTGACMVMPRAYICATASAGLREVGGYGSGFASTRSATLPYLAAGPRAGLVLPLVKDRVELTLQTDAWVVPFLTRLRDDGSGRVLWAQAPYTVQFTAGQRIWLP